LSLLYIWLHGEGRKLTSHYSNYLMTVSNKMAIFSEGTVVYELWGLCYLYRLSMIRAISLSRIQEYLLQLEISSKVKRILLDLISNNPCSYHFCNYVVP
jgi:hypothetical protein